MPKRNSGRVNLTPRQIERLLFKRGICLNLVFKSLEDEKRAYKENEANLLTLWNDHERLEREFGDRIGYRKPKPNELPYGATL
jgi:hypothetical protein